ncbi:unnamed protein product [Mytilus coruscus]|uniref:Uncharacterized protein n=1 Tax=Mytilus coruscus TaxID=42192 RepID=A0A6J8BTU0_MYTCO|nr:unnamed protein product [Mytilus coruscus]
MEPLIIANEEIKCQKWDFVNVPNHKTGKEIKKRQLVTFFTPAQQLFVQLLDELQFLLYHLFVASWQQNQFRQLNNRPPEKTVVLTMDFAENFSCFSQNEIQGAHWAKDSVTIHPVIARYQCKNQECNNSMVDDIIDVINGCAAQYKSQVAFLDSSMSEVDNNIKSEKAFYGSRHGKNRCDGEGGVIKSKAARIIRNGGLISSAKDLYQQCLCLQKELTNPDGTCNHNRRKLIWVERSNIRQTEYVKQLKVPEVYIL